MGVLTLARTMISWATAVRVQVVCRALCPCLLFRRLWRDTTETIGNCGENGVHTFRYHAALRRHLTPCSNARRGELQLRSLLIRSSFRIYAIFHQFWAQFKLQLAKRSLISLPIIPLSFGFCCFLTTDRHSACRISGLIKMDRPPLPPVHVLMYNLFTPQFDFLKLLSLLQYSQKKKPQLM